MKTEIISANHPNAIQHAIDVLRNDGLVAFPTDTVYGLAAPVNNIESINRLYVVKGRNNTKAIAVLLGDSNQLSQVAVDLSKTAQKTADHLWPGPLTMIVPRNPALPEILSPLPTIGVRIPDHPVALALLKAAGPLAVTPTGHVLSPGARARRLPGRRLGSVTVQAVAERPGPPGHERGH